jgi:signal transduction histidine kinase
LKNLSDGLLSLSKQDTAMPVMQPVSLQDVAGEALNRVLAAAQAKKISIDDTVPALKVLGDMPGLVQAVTVVLDNAIKYSPAGSTVWLAGAQQDGQGALSVKDQGSGIAEADLPHIFDRFYQADRSRTTSETASGYGIGLSIARKIIEQHDGKIIVTSTPGKGSSFKIELPLG